MYNNEYEPWIFFIQHILDSLVYLISGQNNSLHYLLLSGFLLPYMYQTKVTRAVHLEMGK